MDLEIFSICYMHNMLKAISTIKVNFSGELYSWGKGRYGRLGHGDSEDQTKPKLVEALLGYRVIDVACGSGDAQVRSTVCL